MTEAPIIKPHCELCHTRIPRDGMRLCDVCLGLEHPEPEPAEEVHLNTCQVCGEPIVPYKNGPYVVRKGRCQPCLMRKKYGPDWEPGQKEKRRNKLRQEKRAVAKNGNGNGKAPEVPPEEEAASLWPSVELTFFGEDRSMFGKLADLARTERRSVDQQVLWFLERDLARVVG